MKRSKKILISTVAVIGLSMGSISMVSAFGGPNGFGGCRGGYGHGPRGQDKMTEEQSSWMEQRMQDRLGYIKYKLGITEKQEPAWQAFTQSLEDKFSSRLDRKKGRDTQTTVTGRIKMMRDHAEQMVQMADTIETLYKALTPEQQKIADQLGPMGMRRF
jgi:periplasmic protein CpxP/Spy